MQQPTGAHLDLYTVPPPPVAEEMQAPSIPFEVPTAYSTIVMPGANPAAHKRLRNPPLAACVSAGALKNIEIFCLNTDQFCDDFSDAHGETIYERWSGYKPGHPETDTGCSINRAFNDWAAGFIGIPGMFQYKIRYWYGFDGADLPQARLTLWQRKGLLAFGYLPTAFLEWSKHDNFEWRAIGTRSIQNGHLVNLYGFDQHRFSVGSYGKIGSILNDALQYYFGLQQGGIILIPVR